MRLCNSILEMVKTMPGTASFRIRSLLLSLLILLLAISGCRSNSGTWERIEQEGVLRVGLDPTYPPFEVTNESGVAGLDVDLAHALANELGLRVEFVHFGYDGLYDALATKQVDVLISALVIMPGRTRYFAYSEPYFNAGEVLIVPEESSDISEMADLGSRILAVELGAQGHVEGTQWEKRLPNLIIAPYNSAEEAIEAISGAQADAALVDSISGRLTLANQTDDQPQLKLLSAPVTVEPFAMVVRIEDETLLEKLDGSLSSLTASGQLDQIIQQWLGS